MKTYIKLLLVLTMFMLAGCQQTYAYYSQTFLGYFDTVTTYLTYAQSQSDFDEQCQLIEEKLKYYHELFDKYNNYDINNVKAINDNAGKQAVKVDQALIDLLLLSIERYNTISPKVNIAFGSVIDIWHDYRAQAESSSGVGKVPTLTALKDADKHTNIQNIQINKEQQTVYITDPQTVLDVGATAKGYAIELIKQDLIAMGVDNFLISGGGNVASHGQRKLKKEGDFYLSECQQEYCVGIESPKTGNYAPTSEDESENEAVLVVQGESVVTSGDYQRFYQDEKGVKYHHLIDPETLYPAIYFRSVSIVTEDSGLADFLSSTLFLMNYEDGLKLVDSLDGVEAMWFLNDGKIKLSKGLQDNQRLYVIEKERLQ